MNLNLLYFHQAPGPVFIVLLQMQSKWSLSYHEAENYSESLLPQVWWGFICTEVTAYVLGRKASSWECAFKLCSTDGRGIWQLISAGVSTHGPIRTYCQHVCMLHQIDYPFPVVIPYWQKYKADLISKLKALKKNVVWSGDGCFDSMGHSTKYGAYTMFCNT